MGAVKNQMLEVNEMVDSGISVKDTADYFGISQMDVEDILNAQKTLDSEQL